MVEKTSAIFTICRKEERTLMHQIPRLIVIDDDPDVLDTYRTILTFDSVPALVSSRSKKTESRVAVPAHLRLLEVCYFNNGEDAVEAVETSLEVGKPFAGGFFDARLGPGIDGIETARQIKELDPRIYTVVVTAYVDRNVEEISKVLGQDYAGRWDFISKPFISAEILQKTINLVANWKLRQQEQEYLQQLESLQSQEGLVRELLDKTVGTIEGLGKFALQHSALEEVSDALKRILLLNEESGHMLKAVLALSQRHLPQKPRERKAG
jgi:CheY-like chemotaxis protein